jgi:hypothetical protein
MSSEYLQITNAIGYARNLLRIPYRWHRDGDSIAPNDKFWASNDPAPSSIDILRQNKSIVCTGLTNLMRRFVGLPVPGLDGSLGQVGLDFPGTTGIWFMYLTQKDRLIPINPDAKYPRGTLFIRNFSDVETDQGHVAVLLTSSPQYENVLDDYIIHSYAMISYKESLERNIENVGEVGLTKFRDSHYYDRENYPDG